MSNKIEQNISSKTFAVKELSNETPVLFGLFVDGELLTTPAGIPVTANNPRGLLAMCAELDFSNILDVTGINFYGLFCTEKEYMTDGENCLYEMLHCTVAQDPILQLCSGPEAIVQWKYYPLVVEFLEENGLKHPCCAQMPTKDGKRESWDNESWKKNYREIENFVEKQLIGFTTVQSSGFITSMCFLESPILSLMLVIGKATPVEIAYLYLMSNCYYSKSFPDVKRNKEQDMFNKITKYSEVVRTYVELF
jgi:hypothetical protein